MHEWHDFSLNLSYEFTVQNCLEDKLSQKFFHDH